MQVGVATNRLLQSTHSCDSLVRVSSQLFREEYIKANFQDKPLLRAAAAGDIATIEHQLGSHATAVRTYNLSQTSKTYKLIFSRPTMCCSLLRGRFLPAASKA